MHALQPIAANTSDRWKSMQLVLGHVGGHGRSVVWHLFRGFLTHCPKKGQMYTEWCRLCRGGSRNRPQQEQHHWYIQRDCQRIGQHALRFDTLNSVCKVVGEPGKAVIRKTEATESADKNMVIDRVESLGQVDEDSCTVLSFIVILMNLKKKNISVLIDVGKIPYLHILAAN